MVKEYGLYVLFTLMNNEIKIKSAILQEEPVPYAFYVNEREITSSLDQALDSAQLEASEEVLEIIYQPQAVFKGMRIRSLIFAHDTVSTGCYLNNDSVVQSIS